MKMWMKEIYTHLLKHKTSVEYLHMFGLYPHVSILYTPEKAKEFTVQRFIDSLNLPHIPKFK